MKKVFFVLMLTVSQSFLGFVNEEFYTKFEMIQELDFEFVKGIICLKK